MLEWTRSDFKVHGHIVCANKQFHRPVSYRCSIGDRVKMSSIQDPSRLYEYEPGLRLNKEMSPRHIIDKMKILPMEVGDVAIVTYAKAGRSIPFWNPQSAPACHSMWKCRIMLFWNVRAVPEIILRGGGPHFFSDPPSPGHTWSQSPPTPRTRKCFN